MDEGSSRSVGVFTQDGQLCGAFRDAGPLERWRTFSPSLLYRPGMGAWSLNAGLRSSIVAMVAFYPSPPVRAQESDRGTQGRLPILALRVGGESEVTRPATTRARGLAIVAIVRRLRRRETPDYERRYRAGGGASGTRRVPGTQSRRRRRRAGRHRGDRGDAGRLRAVRACGPRPRAVRRSPCETRSPGDLDAAGPQLDAPPGVSLWHPLEFRLRPPACQAVRQKRRRRRTLLCNGRHLRARIATSSGGGSPLSPTGRACASPPLFAISPPAPPSGSVSAGA